MTTWNVETIRDLIIEAGKIALSHYDRPDTQHKHDSSLVTVADHAVEAFLTEALAPGTDSAVLIGEESVGGTTQEEVDVALSNDITWVVDPIDGTAPYANRLPTWAISIGLVRNGRFSEGAIFLPSMGELFITSGSDVLYGAATSDPDTWVFDKLTPLSKKSIPYTTTGMLSLPYEIMRTPRFTGRNPVQSIGSAVFGIAKLLQGSYIGCVTGLKLWDICGAIPMLHRLGYHITFHDRRALSAVVSDQDWITDAAHPRLWKCRGKLFLAHTEETLDYIREHYLIPES